MVEVTELCQRILAALEEPRREKLTALLNTVVVSKGDKRELVEMLDSLCELRKRALIHVGVEDRYTQSIYYVDEDSARSILADALQPSHLRFGDDEHWASDVPIPIHVKITDTGLAMAIKILAERGHDWWWEEAALARPWP